MRPNKATFSQICDSVSRDMRWLAVTLQRPLVDNTCHVVSAVEGSTSISLHVDCVCSHVNVYLGIFFVNQSIQFSVFVVSAIVFACLGTGMIIIVLFLVPPSHSYRLVSTMDVWRAI